MNPDSFSQLKRSAGLLAARLATGLCGLAATLLLGFIWFNDQDSVSVYRLETMSMQHMLPRSIAEAADIIEHCHVEAHVAPGMSMVTLKVDVCGQFQFFYLRQHTQRTA